MDYKESYENWYLNRDYEFDDYERNSLLFEFFPSTQSLERVADIAGGSGEVSAWLEQRGYEAYLVELTDIGVGRAKQRGLIRITQTNIENGARLPFEDNYFDKIFFGDIIEHLFNVKDPLLEIKRILKPGGRLIISCPNMAYWRFRSYYLLDGDFHRIDVAKQKPWEQEHIRFFSVKVLQELMDQLGFEFVKFRGFNNIWHSRFLARILPNLFAHTIVSEFKKK